MMILAVASATAIYALGLSGYKIIDANSDAKAYATILPNHCVGSIRPSNMASLVCDLTLLISMMPLPLAFRVAAYI